MKTESSVCVFRRWCESGKKILKQELKAIIREEESVFTQAVNLEERANAVQNIQKHPVALNSSTTSFAEIEKDGVSKIVAASSRPQFSKAQRNSLQLGETEVKGTGHAETTIIKYANKHGYTVKRIAASRPICTSCEPIIRTHNQEVKFESALKSSKKR